MIWSAQAQLDTRARNACDDRNIYLFRQGAPNNLTSFTWNTSTCDASGNPAALLPDGLNASEQAHFGNLNVSLLSQYPSMTDGTAPTVDQRTPAVGREPGELPARPARPTKASSPTTSTKLYRAREHVLGDIVNGQPIYVQAPFSLLRRRRLRGVQVGQRRAGSPMLYVPANDGMLHAFYAGTSSADPLGGKEAWAMIPSTVLPKLYRSPTTTTRTTTQFFVDGTPSVSDVYDTGSGTWKTILVGGLNNGGKGYYALDVTDPLAPKGLWEFKWNSAVCPWAAGNTPIGAAVGNTSDCHLGQTYGRPLITQARQRHLGGDGDLGLQQRERAAARPATASATSTCSTPSPARSSTRSRPACGDATTPSGLAQINNFVDLAEINNMTLRVYGTDVLGNIWRFDVNDSITPSGREATLLGTAKDSGGTPQPITIRPELSRSWTATRWCSSAPAASSAPPTSATCRCSRSTASSIR